MFKRLFALLMLLLLVGAALVYWKAGPQGFSHPRQALDALIETLRGTKTAGSVKAALELNRELAAFPITAAAKGDGVVTLRGQVPSEKAKAAAGRLAAAVPGVRRVTNEISVDPRLEAGAPGRTLGENLDDRALEAKIRLAFSLNRGMDGADVAVRVYRRQVVLEGTVDSKAQRALAGEIAENAPQVAGVENEISLRGEAKRPDTAASDLADPLKRVQRALAGNANLSPYRLEVLEKDGRLVLQGRVKTEAEKDLAGYVAREAARGPVDNSLRIEP